MHECFAHACLHHVCAVPGPPEEQAVLQPTAPALKCLEDRNEIPNVCVILTILRMLITCSAREENFLETQFSFFVYAALQSLF